MWQETLAEWLFNGDEFKLPSQSWSMTQVGEPTVTQIHTTHQVRMKNGERRTIKLQPKTLVAVKDVAR